MNIIATVRFPDAAERCWDVVVVGAGPAGALTARELARRDLAVLLVDRASFPRWKVCGCCLNGRALSALAAVGLGDLTERCQAVPLTQMRLAASGRSASLVMSGGAALSRETFDAASITAAISAGAAFLPETIAALAGKRHDEKADGRTVFLRQGEYERATTARLVVAADGLQGRLMHDETGNRPVASSDSRIGAGAIAGHAPDFFHPGTIFMGCAQGGYVGLVRREDAQLTVAAAFDPDLVRRAGGLGEAAALVLADTGWPTVPGLAALHWRGTPTLTRAPVQLVSERVLALGDAAGYIEPFTGEGMAWALTAAAALAPLAERAVHHWDSSLAQEWVRLHYRLVGRRQSLCRSLAWLLRSPRLTRFLVRVLARCPGLAYPFMSQLNS